MTGRGLGAQALLLLWERGVSCEPRHRPVGLLAAAPPERDPEAIARLPLGVRDTELLDLRERLLGPVLDGAADCPRCGTVAAFSITVEELEAAGADASTERTLFEAGHEVRFRPPDSLDFAAAATAPDVAAARARLLERCVESAWRDGEEVPAAELPASVVATLAERLETADPMAVIPLALSCATCGADWLPLLDPGEFLWRELAAAAERLLHEVHTLALAYHWNEDEILAMSPARREFYLGLAPAPPNGGSERAVQGASAPNGARGR